jgi:hypothetical protein
VVPLKVILFCVLAAPIEALLPVTEMLFATV